MDKLTCFEQIREGETEAARLLFGQYGEQIYRNALTATKSKEAARTITREAILELIGSLRTEPEKDGWDLWVESVSARHIELYGLVDRDVQELGQEIFDAPIAEPAALAPEAEVPRRCIEPESRRKAEPSPRPACKQEPLFEDGEEEPTARPRASAGSIIVTILLVLGILLLVWVIVGLLMSFRILPQLDLGYTWFNSKLFPLFW